jgi:predicted TIM-barrel fold metal-dependent hydrolase
MTFNVIDIHPHVITTDLETFPRSPLGGHQSTWSKDRPVSFEQMIVAMDEAGISKSALVQASTCYGHDNSYVQTAVKAHPARFTGVFSVDALAADAPQRIRHWHGQGLTGLRLFTAGSTMTTQSRWLDDPQTFPTWETVEALDIPVCLQVRFPGLPMVHSMAARFPKVRIIIDHLMKPELDDGVPYAKAAPVFELAKYPNVFLKLTSDTVRASKQGKASPQSFFTQLLEAFGAARIAWGSNFPASSGTLKEILDESRQALSFLPDSDQAQIFCHTARMLYPALAD